jgi:hypothetical protein
MDIQGAIVLVLVLVAAWFLARRVLGSISTK